MARRKKVGRPKTRSKVDIQLRNQLSYYRRKYNTQLEIRKSFARANGIEIDIGNSELFKHLNFKEIYEEGITRKDKHGNTIRITGRKAVRIQIQSLKKASNLKVRKEQFINNYIKAMRNVGFGYNDCKHVREELSNLSTNQLTTMAQKDMIPQIAYIYVSKDTGEADTKTKQEIIEKIDDACRLIGSKKAEREKHSKATKYAEEIIKLKKKYNY